MWGGVNRSGFGCQENGLDESTNMIIRLGLIRDIRLIINVGYHVSGLIFGRIIRYCGRKICKNLRNYALKKSNCWISGRIISISVIWPEIEDGWISSPTLMNIQVMPGVWRTKFTSIEGKVEQICSQYNISIR